MNEKVDGYSTRDLDHYLTGLWFLFNAGLVLLAVLTLDSGWFDQLLNSRPVSLPVMLVGILAGVFIRRWHMLLVVMGAAVVLWAMDPVGRYEFKPSAYFGAFAALYLWACFGAVIRAISR